MLVQSTSEISEINHLILEILDLEAQSAHAGFVSFNQISTVLLALVRNIIIGV